MRPRPLLIPTAAPVTLLLALAGCRIDTHRGNDGDHHVSVQTPVGGLNVRSGAGTSLSNIGLPAYPGAIPEDKRDSDNGPADVDVNLGDFHLRVLVAGFTTSDSPEKVRTFYINALAQYGDVLECRNEQPVGKLTRTGQGLTCAHNEHIRTGGRTDESQPRSHAVDTEFKAGSPARQHIVSLGVKDGRTHFGLLSLEVPHSLADS